MTCSAPLTVSKFVLDDDDDEEEEDDDDDDDDNDVLQ
jgi:hypothetical protein